MALGNLYLLFGDVAVHLDELHAVEQRTGDGANGVGGGDEHHVGEVHIHFEEVVVESFVLFGVEHFEQGTGGVAVVSVLRNLVNLIEDEDRVAGIGLDEALDDTAGHGTDVGAAVSADLGLVMQTA